MFMRRSWHYNLEDIERAICEEAGPCQMRLLLPQVDYHAVEGKWMAQLDVIKFLEWYIETAPTSYGYVINGIVRAVKGDIKKSRAMSRKYRWDIAHRQGYKCNDCKTMEGEQIVEEMPEVPTSVPRAYSDRVAIPI